MKPLISRTGALLAAAALVLSLAGCDLFGFLNRSEEEQGSLTLLLTIPDYAGTTQTTGTRVIDPQTESVAVILDGSLVVETALTDLTAVANTDVPSYTNREGTFAVPARSYGSLRIELSDADGQVLTAGEDATGFTVTEGGTTTVPIYCLPLSTTPIDALGVPTAGSLAAGEMAYFTFQAFYEASYEIAATGATAYLFDERGAVAADDETDGTADGVITYTVPTPDGATTASGTHYIGAYSAAGGAFEFTVTKTSTAPTPNHLIINELMLYDGEAVEIYNPTDSDVDLSGWQIRVQRRWRDRPWEYTEEWNYSVFPDLSLPAGGYLMVANEWTDINREYLNSVQRQYYFVAADENSSHHDSNVGQDVRHHSVQRATDERRWPGGWFDWRGQGLGIQALGNSPEEYQIQADFSPDLTKIVYVEEYPAEVDTDVWEVHSAVYISLLDDDTYFRYTVDTTYASTQYAHPRFSPDGTKVVYAFYDGTDYEIAMVDVTDISSPGTPVVLTDNTEDDDYPCFSADGSTIVYSSWITADSAMKLFTMDTDPATADAVQRTGGPEDDTWPVFSPDGNTIAFLRGSDPYSRHVYAVGSDFSLAEWLVTDSATDYRYPAWLDASNIVYSYTHFYEDRDEDMTEARNVYSLGDPPIPIVREGWHRYRAFGAYIPPAWDPTMVNFVRAFEPDTDDTSVYDFRARLWLPAQWRWDPENSVTFSVSLIDSSGIAQDFALLNGKTLQPPTGTVWDTGGGIYRPGSTVRTAARVYEGSSDLGSYIPVDSNSAADWEDSYGTMGFPNDTQANQRTDLYLE